MLNQFSIANCFLISYYSNYLVDDVSNFQVNACLGCRLIIIIVRL